MYKSRAQTQMNRLRKNPHKRVVYLHATCSTINLTPLTVAQDILGYIGYVLVFSITQIYIYT